MIIENKINKKRVSYIIYTDKVIFISKILKEKIDIQQIFNTPNKNGIIKIILQNKHEIKKIVDFVKIKKIKTANKIKNVRIKKNNKKQKSCLFSSMIFSLAKMSEMNFPNIDRHLKMFRIISDLITEKMNEEKLLASYPKYFSKYFIIFSVLHDMGKISIPNRVLYSSKNLTNDEFEIYKTHINFGIDMIKDLSENWNLKDKKILAIAKNIIKDHHENFDGSGYPNSLKNDQISIEGRIISVIDNYIKFLSKEKNLELAHKNAIKYLIQNKLKKFDPKIVDVFISLKDKIYNEIDLI